MINGTAAKDITEDIEVDNSREKDMTTDPRIDREVAPEMQTDPSEVVKEVPVETIVLETVINNLEEMVTTDPLEEATDEDLAAIPVNMIGGGPSSKRIPGKITDFQVTLWEIFSVRIMKVQMNHI